MHNRCLSLITLLLMLLPSTTHALELVLKSNPFERPPLLGDGSAASRDTASQAALPAMKLRATMLAGAYSLANIGGEILGLGEEVNGYKLVEVHSRHVVLEKNATHKTLSIDNDTEKKL